MDECYVHYPVSLTWQGHWGWPRPSCKCRARNLSKIDKPNSYSPAPYCNVVREKSRTDLPWMIPYPAISSRTHWLSIENWPSFLMEPVDTTFFKIKTNKAIYIYQICSFWKISFPARWMDRDTTRINSTPCCWYDKLVCLSREKKVGFLIYKPRRCLGPLGGNIWP